MTEIELIQQTNEGNTDCFEQLVFRYEKQLMRFLRLRCENLSDAEDIFQETFLNAHMYLNTYDQRFAFSTWLFNISLNLIKRHYRSKNKEVPVYDEALVQPTTESDKLNIWFFIKQHLTSEQLSLLWFTYAEEYTGNEVAHLLERSLPWVKINLIRAKKKLRLKLSQNGQAFSDLMEK